MDTHGMNTPTSTEAAATIIDYEGHRTVKLSLADGSYAVVLLHGAQVVSWCPAGGTEQLYLSSKGGVVEGQSVRGGVPVIFPQFEQRGPDRSLPRHGLARTRTWEVESLRAKDDHAMVTLLLGDSEQTRALWPHAFSLELTVVLAHQRLDIELHVTNTGETSWDFSAALHTYLAVSELSQVRLQGLEGCRFIDTLTDGEHIEDHPEKRFSGEMDRIYADAPRSLLLRDGPKLLTIESETFQDVVLWNPGSDKCAELKDMPDEDWQTMLCIEAAQILNPPTLAPGESWTGRQSLVLPG
jgi:glucose-6-phosphate 1-epimerase